VQDVRIRFINNTAGVSGAAVHASDMLQCGWLGLYTTDESTIFNYPENVSENVSNPFYYE